VKRSTINVVVILAIISLSGVVITQIYWVQQAFGLQEREFNDRVVITMSAVVDRIQAMKNDPAIVEPVKQETSNFFIANINDTLHPYLLETLLREEFNNSNLTEDFEYGIYDCFNDSIVFGSRLRFSETEVVAEQENINIQQRFDKDGHYFGIYFPNKESRILANMDFWIFSSFMILMVTIFFAYAISIMLKQKRLSEVKTDFINNMTHELKTPISTISVSADVLLDPKISDDPDRLHQYARIIQNENNRLKTQVDKVLQIATLTPEKVALTSEPIDLHQVIEQAVETFKVKIEEQQGKIDIALSAQNSIIHGDKVHVTNIVYNLLDNACKYTESNPEVRIETSNNGTWLNIVFKDKGIGIDAKHIDQLFNKFFRVPTGNVHDVKGFGLGLYYVRTIINAHGGKISVTSEPGKGSEFTVAFQTISK
jgi:two-component system phosphate regulon sensor histidine kinase PhoR